MVAQSRHEKGKIKMANELPPYKIIKIKEERQGLVYTIRVGDKKIFVHFPGVYLKDRRPQKGDIQKGIVKALGPI